MADVPAPAEEEQIDWAYCHTGDCQVFAKQVFHPIDETPLTPDERGLPGEPCSCGDLDHPHQVMCQCGELMLHTRPTE